MVDGGTLPQQAHYSVTSNLVAGLPPMIGTTRTEDTQNMPIEDASADNVTFTEIADAVRFLFGANEDRIEKVYVEPHPGFSLSETPSLIRSDWPARVFRFRSRSRRRFRVRRRMSIVWTGVPTIVGELDVPACNRHPLCARDLRCVGFAKRQAEEGRRNAAQISEAWMAFA